MSVVTERSRPPMAMLSRMSPHGAGMAAQAGRVLGIRGEADAGRALPGEAGGRIVAAEGAGVEDLADRIEPAGPHDRARLLAVRHAGIRVIGRDDPVAHDQRRTRGGADDAPAMRRRGGGGAAPDADVARPLAELVLARPAFGPVERGGARLVGAQADRDVERDDRAVLQHRRELIGDRGIGRRRRRAEREQDRQCRDAQPMVHEDPLFRARRRCIAAKPDRRMNGRPRRDLRGGYFGRETALCWRRRRSR